MPGQQPGFYQILERSPWAKDFLPVPDPNDPEYQHLPDPTIFGFVKQKAILYTKKLTKFPGWDTNGPIIKIDFSTFPGGWIESQQRAWLAKLVVEVADLQIAGGCAISSPVAPNFNPHGYDAEWMNEVRQIIQHPSGFMWRWERNKEYIFRASAWSDVKEDQFDLIASIVRYGYGNRLMEQFFHGIQELYQSMRQLNETPKNTWFPYRKVSRSQSKNHCDMLLPTMRILAEVLIRKVDMVPFLSHRLFDLHYFVLGLNYLALNPGVVLAARCIVDCKNGVLKPSFLPNSKFTFNKDGTIAECALYYPDRQVLRTLKPSGKDDWVEKDQKIVINTKSW